MTSLPLNSINAISWPWRSSSSRMTDSPRSRWPRNFLCSSQTVKAGYFHDGARHCRERCQSGPAGPGNRAPRWRGFNISVTGKELVRNVELPKELFAKRNRLDGERNAEASANAAPSMLQLRALIPPEKESSSAICSSKYSERMPNRGSWNTPLRLLRRALFAPLPGACDVRRVRPSCSLKQ